ncbi:TetR/AcrR family transcriptional regulator [Streptomyces griseoluteus]|uniref:TetR/AcrR family transcriptional regulator n=1 Tax=Streptomyces griseoluteus TaxID=29306 RepID=UPI0037F31FEE
MTDTAGRFTVPRPPATAAIRPYSPRQEEILDGIEALVLADGFRFLRLAAVTKKLNTSFATLYQLAPARDELIALVIRRWYANVCVLAVQRLQEETEPVGRLRMWTQFGVAGATRTSRQFWQDAESHEAIREIVRTYSHYYTEVLRAILDDGITAGAFRPVNTALLAAVWETSTMRLADPEYLPGTRTLRELSEDWVDLVLHGLLPDAGT